MIGLGLAVVAFDRGWGGLVPVQGLALFAVALGFLVWNRPPARLFLGDVGSVPFGYLIGWLLLLAATRGGWAAALILPAYFLADSGVTLFLRSRRGASILEAHSEHFYQRAIRAGRSHGQVALIALLANVALLMLAFGAERGERLAALFGAGLVAWLALRMLARRPAARRAPGA
jgi:UDP-N-acetylmuramyl pentapeptide phosphotransferase/UDP-N-acetylglucosamine-1-phosphate transferase